MILSKVILSAIATAFLMAGNLSAQENTDSKAAPTTESKTGRKKKAAICAECGKPETECECDHAGKEGDHKGHDHKKEEKKK